MVAIADLDARVVLTEMQSADEVRFIDALWSRDGRMVFATDASGALTSFVTFAAGSQIPQYTSHDLFEQCEFQSGASGYCDRRGKRLKYQPTARDIRTLSLQFDVLQHWMLQAAATELLLIQKLTSQTDRPLMSTSASAAVGPPPLHVRLSVECPVNPHAAPGSQVGSGGSEDDGGKEIASVFASEVDDWNFDDDSDGSPDSLIVFCASDVPEGLWESWQYVTMFDSRCYFPQVGDSVSLVWPTYLQVLEELGVDAPDEQVGVVSQYVVKQMSVESGRLSLVLSGDKVVSVWFPIPPTKSFLVLTDRMEAAVKLAKALRPHDSVGVFIVGKDMSVKLTMFSVVEVLRPVRFECVKATAEDGTDVLLSPWEIAVVNDEIVAEGDGDGKVARSMSHFAKALGAVAKDSANKEWLHVVGSDDPRYVKGVQFPMSLTVIKERIESGYYRSMDSVVNDLETLFQNIQAYHRDDEDIIDQATEMRNTLTQAVRAAGRKRK
jgi:hypothetical protein